ncbi:small GTP-binding [Chlorella sorokiniana]|uniref:Small GTP-binding n=1 Tax=Chlorella sorokiniana TaxID=3076 RepID=A0A2P6U2R6_CHLSO|nr:small GTP-binding [Chlorella sorokiniana]|eukprot:PRW60606.1 small GTP-binding [Chlorella sorokiniana]
MDPAAEVRSRIHSLRCWVLRRRALLRRLIVTFPGYPWEPSEGAQQRVSQLVACLASTLGGGLQRLDLKFTCYAPWSDLYIPLPDPGGPGGLQELVLRDVHLPAAPEALGNLAGSLTLLSISMCEGYAEQQEGLPGLAQALQRLTSLRRLELRHMLFDSVPASLTALSRLTALVLSKNFLTEAQLPEEGLSLAQLQLLDLSDCELWRVPPILQSFTALRTLLLGGNSLHAAEFPATLSALGDLAELALPRNRALGSVPEAVVHLSGLTKLDLCATGLHSVPAGPYLSTNLQELDLSRNTMLPASNASILAGASCLRRLSLAHTLPHDCRLPLAVASLQHLTCLDVGFVPAMKFPPGPYAASLRVLHADGLDVRADKLPLMPSLQTLVWRYGRKITLGEARMLLERAPALRTLGLDASLRITLPAERLLSAAGVAAGEYTPQDGAEPYDY